MEWWIRRGFESLKNQNTMYGTKSKIVLAKRLWYFIDKDFQKFQMSKEIVELDNQRANAAINHANYMMEF